MDMAPHGMATGAMTPTGMTMQGAMAPHMMRTWPMAVECWDAFCLVQALLSKEPQIVVARDIDVSG